MVGLLSAARFTLSIVDDASRECLAIEVDHGLSGIRVTRVLDQVAVSRPLPWRIVVDNGPEFTSTALDAWAYRCGVELHFIRPGKPVDNAFIESFNGKCVSRALDADPPLGLDDPMATEAASPHLARTSGTPMPELPEPTQDGGCRGLVARRPFPTPPHEPMMRR
jgi:transposase InsO family protein